MFTLKAASVNCTPSGAKVMLPDVAFEYNDAKLRSLCFFDLHNERPFWGCE